MIKNSIQSARMVKLKFENSTFKKVVIFIFLSFLFISCSEEKIVDESIEDKQDFFIETSKLSSFSGSYEIKKTGKIKPSQDITLSSKASGRVGNISVGFGDNVYVGKNLINLSDNVSNYGLNLEKTVLSLESSNLNYDQNKITLDKQVSDSEIALSRAEKDHEILEKKLKEDIKLAKINLDNSLSSDNSYSGFTSKAKLDYNNLLNLNKEKIKSFEITSKNDYLALKNIFVDVIDFSDGMLGVTNLNKSRNDSFEDYLGIKDTIFLKSTREELINLINFKQEKFDSVDINKLDIESLDNLFILGTEAYPKVINLLDNLEKVLDNSIENVYFSRTQIDSYKSSINAYQSELQGKYNGFLSFKSNVREFLNTYKDNEEILKRSLEIGADSARVTYNKIVLDSEKSLNNSLLSLKIAKLNLENAIKTREVTLKQLKNSINMSKNSRSLAKQEYSKLFIYSPINGVVSDVLVDKGQDVSVGTPLIKLSGLGENEIEVGFSFSEIDLVKSGYNVRVSYLGNTLTGSITSISKVADENLNYKAKININSEVHISGNIVDVFIPISFDKKLIPLENLKVKQDNVGEISVLGAYSVSDSKKETITVEKILVNFGEFYGENVEITGCVDLDIETCNNLEVITSDISKFDENKFNIKIKK